MLILSLPNLFMLILSLPILFMLILSLLILFMLILSLPILFHIDSVSSYTFIVHLISSYPISCQFCLCLSCSMLILFLPISFLLISSYPVSCLFFVSTYYSHVDSVSAFPFHVDSVCLCFSPLTPSLPVYSYCSVLIWSYIMLCCRMRDPSAFWDMSLSVQSLFSGNISYSFF